MKVNEIIKNFDNEESQNGKDTQSELKDMSFLM